MNLINDNTTKEENVLLNNILNTFFFYDFMASDL